MSLAKATDLAESAIGTSHLAPEFDGSPANVSPGRTTTHMTRRKEKSSSWQRLFETYGAFPSLRALRPLTNPLRAGAMQRIAIRSAAR